MNLLFLKPAQAHEGFLCIKSNETLRTGVPLLVELKAASDATPFPRSGDFRVHCPSLALPLSFRTRLSQGWGEGVQGNVTKPLFQAVLRNYCREGKVSRAPG